MVYHIFICGLYLQISGCEFLTEKLDGVDNFEVEIPTQELWILPLEDSVAARASRNDLFHSP